MKKIDPKKKLLERDNIWNVCVIDNIDFKKQTFRYGNIFDITHRSSHVTLHIVFQFLLPISLKSINNNNSNNNNNNNNNNNILFEKSKYTNKLLKKYKTIFNELLKTDLNNWDINDLY